MASPRRVTVSYHGRRPAAVAAAARFVNGMTEHGITCLLPGEQLPALRLALGPTAAVGELSDSNGEGCELAVVFGGDGNILRASEWALRFNLPVLGVNLGHVGFLAELEPHEAGQLIDHVVNREYTVEDRMTIDTIVRASLDGPELWRSFAINEVSLEKLARERMIDVLVRVDGEPLSRWGTDGVLVSSPTGSTAYAFSANGPVLWPDLEGILVVPLSAHALFNRPMVLSPRSVVSVEILPSEESGAVVWCDGRRSTSLTSGMVMEARAGAHRLLLARIGAQPFVTRLVRKFNLPVDGWRGARAD
ncbi:MAG: NAD kinase [Micropruina sp.]|nr:NAD kinase [Micropruina sp.]